MEKKLKSSDRSRMFVNHRLVSAVKRVGVVCDRMLYRDLRGRWCNIIFLNVLAPGEEENNYSKNGFYGEVFDHFPNTVRKCRRIVMND
jgi:hypothetical protein